MGLFSRILESLGLRKRQSGGRASTSGTSTKARKPGGRAPTSEEEVRGAEASARTREKEGAAVQETTRKNNE